MDDGAGLGRPPLEGGGVRHTDGVCKAGVEGVFKGSERPEAG